MLPSPQQVHLGTNDFEFTHAWRLETGTGIKPEDIAVQSLRERLQERFQLNLDGSANAPTVRLAAVPNAVGIGTTTDGNKAALAEQAYRLQLTPARVTITGNTATGVFYGVQTLVQLLKPGNGKLWLPEIGHSTHYHAYWVHPSWVNEMRKLYKIGVHSFYRPRAWGDTIEVPNHPFVAPEAEM